MSATISYKNNGLVSFISGTKTLKTAGKFLEDDITVEVEAPIIQAITVQSSTVTQTITAGLDQEIASNYVYNERGNKTWNIDLSSYFSNGNTLKIIGKLGIYHGTSNYYIIVNEQFIWDGYSRSFGYTEDSYSFTLTVNTDSININTNYPLESGYTLTVYKANNADGFSPITVSPIPSGYIVPTGTINIAAEGTYNVTSYASAVVDVPSDINNQNKTVDPTTSQQTVSPDSGYSGLGTVTVNAISPTKAAATYNVSSSNQTIQSGRWLTGNQTIRGVATSGISAANIKAGSVITVGDSASASRIMSVTGTFTSDANATASDIVSGKSGYVNGVKIDGSLVVQTYYTGSSAPSSNLGSNGDLYFQTAE